MEQIQEENVSERTEWPLWRNVLLLIFVFGFGWYAGSYTPRAQIIPQTTNTGAASAGDDLAGAVMPSGGVLLPVRIGDVGVKMKSVGVINYERFLEFYEGGKNLIARELSWLDAADREPVVINRDNAAYMLNFFWALGLGNDNDILKKGAMSDTRYGGARNFASTAGWTLAQGDAMGHFSRHPLVPLTAGEQGSVERVAAGIFRPCCDNPTHFPDCNHGMAMLGLLQLMAAQGVSEEEMYRTALRVNAYWFPDQYLTIAQYFENRGVAWKDVDAKKVLGKEFSSASGYRQIAAQVATPTRQGGGSCGV